MAAASVVTSPAPTPTSGWPPATLALAATALATASALLSLEPLITVGLFACAATAVFAKAPSTGRGVCCCLVSACVLLAIAAAGAHLAVLPTLAAAASNGLVSLAILSLRRPTRVRDVTPMALDASLDLATAFVLSWVALAATGDSTIGQRAAAAGVASMSAFWLHTIAERGKRRHRYLYGGATVLLATNIWHLVSVPGTVTASKLATSPTSLIAAGLLAAAAVEHKPADPQPSGPPVIYRTALTGVRLALVLTALVLWPEPTNAGRTITALIATVFVIAAVGRILLELTEAERTRAESVTAGRIDPQTGLLTRLAVLDELDHRLRGPGPTALVICSLEDLDASDPGRSPVVAGTIDADVAGQLRLLAGADATLGALSDDQVAIVLHGADRSDAVALVNRISYAMTSNPAIGDAQCYVGAATSDGTTTTDDLVRGALAAVDAARSTATGSYVFDEALRMSIGRRATLERELRSTVATGALPLRFAPALCADDAGAPPMVAATIAWESSLGDVTSEEFTELTGSAGLEGPLLRAMLDAACAEIARRGVAVSVDLTAEQSRNPGLIDATLDACRNHKVAPTMLRVAVPTESIEQQTAELARNLAAMRSLGVCVILSGFGFSTPAVGQLRRFPADAARLPRHLVASIGRQPGIEALLRAVAAAAADANLTLEAEGCDTDQQLDLLRRLGCRYVLGRVADPGYVEQRHLRAV